MATPTKKKSKKKYSEADKKRLEEIEALVTERDNVERFQAAETASEIRQIATELGLTLTKESGDIPKLVVSLRTIQVDLPALAKAEQADLAQQLVSRKDELPAIHLACAAVQSPDEDEIASYAVVDGLNRAVIFGDLFNNDYERIWTPGDAESAEQSAADKAVYVAYRARKAADEVMATLYLTTTYPELDVDRLVSSGARMGIAVDVTVDHEHEAAVIQAGTNGYKSISDRSEDYLAALVEPVDADEADEADEADGDYQDDPDDQDETGHSDENEEE